LTNVSAEIYTAFVIGDTEDEIADVDEYPLGPSQIERSIDCHGLTLPATIKRQQHR
jgi:hypothetical protein